MGLAHGWRARPPWLAMAGACAISAALPCPAAAAPTWLPATDLSGTQSVYCQPESDDPPMPAMCLPSRSAPDVALSPDGRALALWSPWSGSTTHVIGSERTPGGAFSPLGEVAADSEAARLGLDAQGNATALWNRGPPGFGSALETSSRPAGGAFAAPTKISGNQTGVQAIAVAPNGAAVAAWMHDPIGAEPARIEATYRPPGGSLGTPVQVSATGSAFNSLDVAIDGDGDAIAAWTRFNGSTYVPEFAAKPAAGAFDIAAPVAAGAGTNIRVAMNGTGDAAASWVGAGNVLHVSARPAGGVFTDTAIPGTNIAGRGDVDISSAGEVLAAWTHYTGSGYQRQWSLRPAGGSFSSSQPLGAGSISSSQIEVEFLPDRGAAAVWSHYVGGTDQRIQSAIMPTGGPFGNVLPVAQTTRQISNLRSGSDGDGNLGAIWLEYTTDGTTTASDRIRTSVLDGAGPRLNALAVPSDGPPGQALAFAVEPADAWSTVASTEWNFGDGTSASGASVQHAFAGAGTYTVEVKSTDNLGNERTASRTVTIAAPQGGDVTPDDGPGDGPGDAPGTGSTDGTADVLAPIIEGFSATNRTFRVGRKPTPLSILSRRAPVGTTFRFDSSEAGVAKLRIERAQPGRRLRGHCVRPTRALRKRPRCTRWRTRGTLTRLATVGKNSVRFTGRLGKTALRPGHYRAVLQVTDAAGNRSAATRARFRIVR